MRLSANILMIILLVAWPKASQAVILNVIDQGWYLSSGAHNPANTNYFAGDAGGGSEIRNFFVFDLTGVTDVITSATLRLFNPIDGFMTDAGSETYVVNDVSTSIASLTAGSGGVAAFNDLGSGTQFGSFVVTAANNGTFIMIPLNAAAVTALNAATALFAFGGNVTTLDLGSPTNEWVFGNTGGLFNQLVLTTAAVPEPSTLLLLGSALAGLGFLRRRKK